MQLAALGSSVHTEVADVATVQIRFASGAVATITASRATEEKIRTLAITQPDAYIVLDYTEQDIHIYRRAAQEYTMNRGAIRYRRASFVEHLKVHRDNPLKLEIQHLLGATRRRRRGGARDAGRAGRPPLAGDGAGDRADDPGRRRRGHLARARSVIVRCARSA